MQTGKILTAFIVLSLMLFLGCQRDNIPLDYQIQSIQTNKKSLSLEAGQHEQIKAFAVPSVAVSPVFTWASSDEDIAVVSDLGMVEARSPGNTVVTVSFSHVSASVPVSVSPRKFVPGTYSDTIVHIVLKGAGCPFADSAHYGIYLPAREEPLRGVLILQHGCGMEQFGITRPYDLQYQAFARKWKLAVIETALYGNCGRWRDPASGTANALLKVLEDTGAQSGHPELKNVPWLMWGHSGGGYWTLAMLREYPDRILAAVCYSAAWNPAWAYPEATAKIPVLMRHAGADDGGESAVCWATATNTFLRLRNMDAPICIAHNTGQNHNFSFIRYMAIPFFEAAMEQRMPAENLTPMRDLDPSRMWLGDTLSLQLYKRSDFKGNTKGMCLFPDETTAKRWKEFVITGKVEDKTPPPSPFNVLAKWRDNAWEVTWEADADIESGISRFNIFKNGILIGKLPDQGAYQYFDTNGDNTIPVKVPDMKFSLPGAKSEKLTIFVQTVNQFNLVSGMTEAIFQ